MTGGAPRREEGEADAGTESVQGPLADRWLGGALRAGCAWLGVLPGLALLEHSRALAAAAAGVVGSVLVLERRRGRRAPLFALAGVALGAGLGMIASAALASATSGLHPVARGEAFMTSMGHQELSGFLLRAAAGAPALLLLLAIRRRTARLGPALAAAGVGGVFLALGRALATSRAGYELPALDLLGGLLAGLGLAIGAFVGDRVGATLDPSRSRPAREADPGRALATGVAVLLLLLGVAGGHWSFGVDAGYTALREVAFAQGAFRNRSAPQGAPRYARSLSELHEAGLISDALATGLSSGCRIRLRTSDEAPDLRWVVVVEPCARRHVPGNAVFWASEDYQAFGRLPLQRSSTSSERGPITAPPLDPDDPGCPEGLLPPSH